MGKRLAVLSGLFLSILSAARPVWAAEPGIFLDTHLHVENFQKGSGGLYLNEYLKSGYAEKVLLISPSYLLNSREPFLDTIAKAKIADELTSRLVKESEGRALGLCGFSPSMPGADNNLSQCMKLPGMRGIKVRYEYYVIEFNVYVNEITKALQANPNTRFMLIHMPLIADLIGSAKSAAQKNEADALLAMVKRFPNVEFIIAHSFYSPDMVALVSDKRPSNLWIEISTVTTNMLPHDQEEQKSFNNYVESWRKFGFDRILFGSDSMVDPSQNTLKEGDPFEFDDFDLIKTTLKNLERFPLTPQERKALFQDNGRVFWERVNR